MRMIVLRDSAMLVMERVKLSARRGPYEQPVEVAVRSSLVLPSTAVSAPYRRDQDTATFGAGVRRPGLPTWPCPSENQELAFHARPFVLCGLPLRRPEPGQLTRNEGDSLGRAAT